VLAFRNCPPRRQRILIYLANYFAGGGAEHDLPEANVIQFQRRDDDA